MLKKAIPKSWMTRANIFHAALRLLSKQEIADITVRSIAKEAGIGVGSFYYYYKTKFDVFYDAYSFMDNYFENVVASSLPDGSAWDQLIYYFDQYHYYNIERTPFKLYKLIVLHASAAHLQSATYGYFRVLCSIVHNGQKQGTITQKESPEDIALFLISGMRSIYRHWMLLDGAYDIETGYRTTAVKLLSVYMQPPKGYIDYRVAEQEGGQKGFVSHADEETVPIGQIVPGREASY